MTPLGRLLAQRIAATGPICLADYMADCLMHPVHGYYATRDPFGAGGDFTTAPEISQMFGELVGLCLAQAWLDQGAPARVTLAELGPGRGTLMADALRATKGVPGFHAAVQVHLVEASPTLRARQAQAVPGAVWHDSVATLPDQPLFLIANEFLDALPIRQFQRADSGWAEVMVRRDGDRLAPGLAPPALIAELDHRLADTGPGQIVETCPALPGIVHQVAARIALRGGAALFIDYGHWQSLGDTLQALQGHRPVSPFDQPGQADLTAHVDFAAIAANAAPAQVSAMTPQGVFLERLGITARAQALARRGDRQAIAAAHRRLTHPGEMGDLFKVIGLAPQGAPLPPGLLPP
jgi:NADH dehydrogenase [ubiquinone] 1 alpha subcomplex assembly factor 7